MRIQDDYKSDIQDNGGRLCANLKRKFLSFIIMRGTVLLSVFAGLLFWGQIAAAATFTVTNTNDSGAGSLRQAIINANASPGSVIDFNIPVTDLNFVDPLGAACWNPITNSQTSSPCWWRISLATALPVITANGTQILGFTQTAFVQSLGLADPNPGVVGTGGTVGVDACPLPQYQRPEIAINGGGLVSAAFRIHGAASNVILEGMAVYNVGAVSTDAVSAIVVANFVGGPGVGVGNEVRKMLVGTLPDGSDPVAQRNKGFGVRLFDPYHLTVTENFIGHNGRGGMDGAANASVLIATKNEVFDNGGLSDAHDGLDVNGINGLAECNLSRDNTNILLQPKGDAGNGIEIGSKSANAPGVLDNNVIRNNTVHGNLSAGISARKGVTGNIIEKNVIYDNEIGISVDWEGRTPTDRNLISRNSIFMNMGLGIDLQAPRPNNTGVFGSGGQFETTAWVGYESGPVGAPSFPLLGGVGPDGVTQNDTCDPDATSNQLQNWPTLTSVITDGSMTLISGTLNSTANTTFTLEFFATPDGTTFGTGDREGQTFLGSTTVPTDGTCNASFTATFSVGLTDDDVVTATATGPAMGTLGVANTSEFSNSVPVAPSGQKVTGGGTYSSPAGAYTADPDVEGRASFGFNIKLKDLNPVPQGVTNFRFRPADLHFISTSYEAGSFHVVDDMVSGKNADWRGTGKLNGAPGRCFQVNVHDDGQGAEPQGTEQDKFRIKIWEPTTPGDCSATAEASATVVYDNDSSASLAGQAGTLLDGGNIEVHETQN